MEGDVEGLAAECTTCCQSACNGCCRGGKCHNWFVNGWLAQGYTWNPENPPNGFNTPLTFNDRANEYQLNQMYLSFGREVVQDSWDLGGRVDALYGTDYFFVQATGLELTQENAQHWNSSNGPRAGGTAAMYGLAMPQAYVELQAPVANGLNFKFGHFYSIIGYESAMAPANFFYSHSYTRQYAEPFTQTGMLADLQTSERVSFQGGVVRGWNIWDDPDDKVGFLGGMTWCSEDGRTALTFALNTGEEPAGLNTVHDRTSYSVVASRRVTDRLTYIFQNDYGIEDDAAQSGDAQWYSIVQYLFYELSSQTELGFRFEWFNDVDNARVLGIPLNVVQGSDYFEATLGLNWRPRANILLRPEARWDWSNVVPPFGAVGMYNDFTDKSMFTAAVDLVISF